jgi:hypothetical protein
MRATAHRSLLAGLWLLAAWPLAAQQPRLVNARLETRSAAAGLEREFRALVAAQTEPAWIGYAAPIVSGKHAMCCSSGARGCGCGLEDRQGSTYHSGEGHGVKLEGAHYIVALFRVEQKTVGIIRAFTEDCELDAGGLPFFWLTDVKSAESAALVASFVSRSAEESKESKRRSESALHALAMHADPAADRQLEAFLAAGQPEWLRSRTAFWLGAARGGRGVERLERLAREDPSDKVREQAVFALHVSKEPRAVDAIIRAAREDKSLRVRGQALFWLAQTASDKAGAAITQSIADDPETEVKKKAVFALSQLPKAEGVPLLIQVARTNRNAAVRKQAIFWLGQSNDPRALAFFEEVLKQ